ncbi:MAG: HAD-IG family 5'-nucleotidase [Acidimicrobiales bacterium]
MQSDQPVSLEDPDFFAPPAPERRVYANRTMNLRSLRAVGFDMDYTLVHYHSDEWEAAAFDHARSLLLAGGWPVGHLRFDPTSVTIGLAFDLEAGNLVKATRFGYVIRAAHGSRLLSYDELRQTYSGTIVDLAEGRFRFMNTLFSLSEASLFAQLVDEHDAGNLPGVSGYPELYRRLLRALDETHTQGDLKRRIVADPTRFVDIDPALPETLEDLRAAGKVLLLITNSDWFYTRAMMGHTFDPLLGPGRSWRELFDIVIVEANKPAFFSDRHATYRLVDPDAGLLEPHRGPLQRGEVYVGGDAAQVEASLGLSGSELLYLGDHLFGDVHVSKAMLRWRTGLVVRELEAEIAAARAFRERNAELEALMAEKVALDQRIARLRLARQRLKRHAATLPPRSPGAVESELRNAASRAAALDARIAPLARAASSLGNDRWGPIMRAGSDKSLYARQVERHADVYTSRVSNLGLETPYGYLRADRGSLPHDRDVHDAVRPAAPAEVEP